MVDAEDLKSFGHCDRVGSSPTIPTRCCRFGCVAQLVRALRSHRRGRWFESNHIHQNKKKMSAVRRTFLILFIAGPFRGSMRMRHCANRRILMMGCANRAMVANRCIFLPCPCRCILHNGANCMFGSKPDPCRLCI